MPLDQHIAFKAVSGGLEQDLETVPGFRSRHVFAAKFDDIMRHGYEPQPPGQSADFTRRRHGGALRNGQIEILSTMLRETSLSVRLQRSVVRASEWPSRYWTCSRGTSCLRRSVAVVARKEWQEKVPSGRPAALRRRLTIRRRSLPVSARSVSALAFHRGAEDGGLVGLAGDAGRLDEGFHLFLEIVPCRHLVDLAAFLAEVEPPLVAVGVLVADLEPGDGAGPRGGVGENHEQCLVAQADNVGRVDGSEEVLDLLLGKGGGLAFVGDMLGAADGGGGVETDAVIELLVGEEVAESREVLLFAGRGQRVTVLVEQVMLKVVADQEGRDDFEDDVIRPAPVKEAVDGALLGFAGVGVADARLEEVGVSVLGVWSGFLDDERWHDLAAGPVEVTAAHQHATVTVAVDACRHVNDFGNDFGLVWSMTSPLPGSGSCRNEESCIRRADAYHRLHPGQ